MMTRALLFAAAIFISSISSAQTMRPDRTTTTKPITEPPQGGSSDRGIANGPADRPASRNDDSTWLNKHIELVEKAKKGNIDLYFEGDSITRRWEALHKANWDQNFGGWQPGNFGAGGDRTQNVLYRLANGELDGVNPKVVVLMIGTNNVGFVPTNGGDDAFVEDITRGIKACVDVLHKKAPNAKILLMGITPRNTNGSTALMPMINKINERIARFADNKTIRFLNINDQLADKNGKLYDGMTDDGLHLTDKGYQVWADAMRPILTEWLGARQRIASKIGLATAPSGRPR